MDRGGSVDEQGYEYTITHVNAWMNQTMILLSYYPPRKIAF